MPDFQFEDKYKEKIIAGIDEAGRGPWAGPVVAAAAIFKDRSNIPDGLNDSKKLSAKKREAIFSQLIEICDFGIGIINQQMIDEINILQATKLAMKTAVNNLYSKPDVILIDGNQNIDITGVKSETIIKGDSLSLSIAAASIIAKVSRDKIMKELDEKFPHYGWASNSGYGTKQHSEALEKHGVTEHHRKSFAPIKKLLNTH